MLADRPRRGRRARSTRKPESSRARPGQGRRGPDRWAPAARPQPADQRVTGTHSPRTIR